MRSSVPRNVVCVSALSRPLSGGRYIAAIGHWYRNHFDDQLARLSFMKAKLSIEAAAGNRRTIGADRDTVDR